MKSQSIRHNTFVVRLAVGTAWSFLVGAGCILLATYSLTPGEKCNPLAQWPDRCVLSRDNTCPTLLVFIHPRCPCSQATISELERILAECPRRIDCVILSGCPSNDVKNWERTNLAVRSASITGAKLQIDPDGIAAANFGVVTSGHCLLYSESGTLLFSGGITSERGHEGESVGRIAIRNVLLGKGIGSRSYPVFGCNLISTKANQTLK